MTEEKTYSQMRNEFYTIYRTKIIPMVQGYENERKRTRIFATIVSSILAFLSAGFIAIEIMSGKISSDGLKVALFLGFAAWFSWNGFKKSFENKIKQKIMPDVCSCFAKLSWKNSDYAGNSNVFEKSCVIPAFTGSDYDDIFSGSHKNVRFEIIESEFARGSGKNRTTVFKGVIVKLDMNKNFNSHTVIKPDSMIHKSPAYHLEHTTLEDVKFEKKYDVFTNDPVDARYLITPSFMERLNNIKIAFNANKISCAFYKDKLFIALSTNKDLFSICSLVKPIDDEKQYFTMYEEIISIIKLIDHFKLNQKIGL